MQITPKTLSLTPTMDQLHTLRCRESLAPRVLMHADLLPSDERALIESVFAHHTPVTLIAAAAGTPTRGSRRLRHRLHRLVERILSWEFRAVARAIVSNTLSQLHRNVARRRFLHARTLRQTADELDLPLHVVRRASAEVEFYLGLKHTKPTSLALAA